MARARKGISPVIATVIIVAVAIAISIAVAGWLFGLWGGLASGTPQVQVSNAVVTSDGTIELYIVNQGSGADTLLRVELNNGTTTVQANLANANVTGTGIVVNTDGTVSIQANAKGWLTTSVTGVTLNPGQSVTIKVYFEKSGTVTIPVTVQG